MSEETARKLEDAKRVQQERQIELDTAKQSVLTGIASRIPARIDDVAKQTAHSQPDVTKNLGGDGVKQLRADLASAAENLATTVAEGADQIKWPAIDQPAASPVTLNSVRRSVFDFMHGRRIDEIAHIMKRFGYDIHDDNAQASQGLVSVNQMFDEQNLEPIAVALTRAREANAAVRRAKAADDRDVVDSLWDE
jgi:hypothetical protein